MGFATTYLMKQEGFYPSFFSAPDSNLNIIVVIPCFNEPSILETLESLSQCTMPHHGVEVLIIVNSSFRTDEQIKAVNELTYNKISEWSDSKTDNRIKFLVVNFDNLPQKFHGAGLARKIGMDIATERFNEIDNENGIIVSLDADTLVSKNYLVEIENSFQKNRDLALATINFEHPVSGKMFSKIHYEAIVRYELHIRYYKLSLDYAGNPYSAYTIGSAFAVRVSDYSRQGGMNKRQAGEDFYFIQKILPTGKFTHIKSAVVYPSGRLSNRVPFGTGPMIEKIIEEGTLLTYNFKFFEYLKLFIDMVPLFYEPGEKSISDLIKYFPIPLRTYLINSMINEKIVEIKTNSASYESFYKRFFTWCNGFFILKMNNFIHDNYLEKVPVTSAVKSYLNEINRDDLQSDNIIALLKNIRKLN